MRTEKLHSRFRSISGPTYASPTRYHDAFILNINVFYVLSFLNFFYQRLTMLYSFRKFNIKIFLRAHFLIVIRLGFVRLSHVI